MQHGITGMAGAKKQKLPPARTAADRRIVIKTVVATPYDQTLSPGESITKRHVVQQTHKVQDTIDTMYKRHQLNERQFQSAQKYRNAVDTLSGGGTCTLDTSKGMGGNATNRTPAPIALLAADTLNEATLLLGMIDGSIVWHIAGRGESIAECAQRFMAEGIDRRRRHEVVTSVGDRFRAALDVLSDRWFPTSAGKPKMRGWVTPNHEAADGSSGEVMPGRVAHAGRGRVDFSGR